VRGVYSAGSSGTHLTITVGQRTVGYYRVAGALGNHIPWPVGAATGGALGGMNLYELCYKNGWHRGYPIAAGQTMNWSGPNAAGSVNAVLYDVYDRDDIKATMPNGSESAELDYLIYGNTGATISSATTSAYDTAVNPSEFDAFPFGVDVPGLTQLTMYGVLGSTFSPSENDSTDQIGTTYLKFVRNQTVLFDKDLNGLPFWVTLATQSADAIGTGSSLVGNFSTTDQRPPLVFPEPMIFGPGEELTISVTTAGAGTPKDILIADQELALIVRGVRG
jgi:hypothetical protein